MKEDRSGWWEVPPSDTWICPECKTASDVSLWTECSPYCEDCGEHDGRECPECGEQFDHVWGSNRIEIPKEDPNG